MDKNNTFDFKSSLGPQIGRTMKLIEHRIEEVLAQNNIDLSRMQFIILKTIEKNKGICQNELAYFCNRNKSSLTRMIDILLKKGYISKRTSNEDKRKNAVYVSEQGLLIMDKATPHFEQIALLVELGLSEEEIGRTNEILTKIQNNVKIKENILHK